ncbi:MAG: histidine kinase [Bacteroidota bacterium]
MTLFIISLLLGILQTHGQPQAVDSSLYAQLRKSSADTTKIDLLYELGKAHYVRYQQLDSTFLYVKRGLTLAQKIKDKKRQITGLSYLGSSLIHPKNDEEKQQRGVEVLEEGIRLAKKENDQIQEASMSVKLASVFFNRTEPEKSIQYYLRSIEILETLEQDYDRLAQAYTGIGGVYVLQQQKEKRLLYTRKALAILDKVSSPFVKALVYSYAAQQYIELEDQQNNFLDTARLLSQKGLDLVEKHQLMPQKASFLLNLSNISRLQGAYSQSIQYSKLALAQRNYISPVSQMLIYTNLSQCETELENYARALSYLDSAARYKPAQENNYHNLPILKQRYELQKKIGNLSAALESYEEYATLLDQITNEKKNKQINELEEKYNKAKNEQTIRELSQAQELLQLRERFLWVLLGLGGLVVLVIIFYFRQRNLSQKFATLKAQLRLNRVRLNPHLFFNILASLQAFALKTRDIPAVALHLSRYAKVMRASLESTFTDFVSLEEEIAFLESYLAIQDLLSEQSFTYQIQVDENLDAEFVQIPTLLIQPFVENAIEHGFSGKESGGDLLISFGQKGEQLEVCVKDNGSGLSFLEAQNNVSGNVNPSRATQIIRDRLSLLEQTHKVQTYFSIQNNPDQGVAVTFRLPLHYASTTH